jgi:uroporphyrinogen-III synthase
MSDNDSHGRETGARTTILLTRPRAQSGLFAAQIRAHLPEARVVIAPLMDIVPTATVPELAEGDALIFTSANGVAAAGQGQGRTAWCVGERTAAVARDAGYAAHVAGRTAEELVEHLRGLRPAGRLVHLHGAHTRGDVAGGLAAAGLQVADFAVYDQVALEPGPDFAAALASAPLVVPLFSPRSAVLFAEAAARTGTLALDRGLFPLALSPAVREALPARLQGVTAVCDRPDATAMLDGIVRRVYRYS